MWNCRDFNPTSYVKFQSLVTLCHIDDRERKGGGHNIFLVFVKEIQSYSRQGNLEVHQTSYSIENIFSNPYGDFMSFKEGNLPRTKHCYRGDRKTGRNPLWGLERRRMLRSDYRSKEVTSRKGPQVFCETFSFDNVTGTPFRTVVDLHLRTR